MLHLSAEQRAMNASAGAVSSSAPISGAREKLLARIGDINNMDRPRPLVSLSEFFEGNNDPGSIGYNLADLPSPSEWYQLLSAIGERSDVREVLVEVKDLEDPGGWPSTDTIWIVTTARAEEVRGWLPERTAPDELLEGFENSLTKVEPYDLPADYHAIGLWYD